MSDLNLKIAFWDYDRTRALINGQVKPEGIDLEQVEEDLIRQALEMSQGNKSRAARLLGLTRATLLYRLDKYAIDATD